MTERFTFRAPLYGLTTIHTSEPDLIHMSAELEEQMPTNHWSRADIVVEIAISTALNFMLAPARLCG